MKKKHQNNADAIKYLSILCDKEIQKPVEEMDCDLISSGVKILLNLQGKKVSFAEKELEKRVRKITVTANSDNVKKFTANKNVRIKTTQKRILLIAAVIAILVAILSFVSVAYEWNIIDSMKEKFGSVHNAPVGEEYVENGVIFVNNGKNIKYKSLDELIEKEDINVLFPDNLPNNIKVERIIVSKNGENQTLHFIFSDDDLFFLVTLNCDVPDATKEQCKEKVTINSTDYYISNLPDAGISIVEFSCNENYYRTTYNDMQILLDIIKNLEEK